jgi:transposase
MANYYIGADVDSKMTELAIEKKEKIINRYRVPTTIPALREVLASIPGTKFLTFEEGPMAGWLYRNLKDNVDDLVVCDPRRNKLIACDGDKDDSIDAGKLAGLLRGGFLRAVHQSEDIGRIVLKQWVSLYHDKVREAVRQINKIRARCRMYGIRIPRRALRDQVSRHQWMTGLREKDLAEQLAVLWIGFYTAAKQVEMARKQLIRHSKNYEIVKYWSDVPGIALIRATTMLAYLDTPWRFSNEKKLWKYCGVGLQRTASGTDRYGKPNRGKLQLAWAVNRRLKGVVTGAAMSAINQKNNIFAYEYGRMIRNGLTLSNARHAVARKMLSVLWAMWKTTSRFDESLVCYSPVTVKAS